MGLLISLETSAGCGLAKAENAIGQNAVCALELEMPGWGRLTRQQKSSTKCRECTRRAGEGQFHMFGAVAKKCSWILCRS